MAHPEFTLNREEMEKKLIDPTGRKWVIKGERGNALVHARPDPDRADAVIPKEFKGRWTSPQTLRTRIFAWVSKQWDHAETKARKKVAGEFYEKADSVIKAKKQSVEDSLESLPQEVKDLLGDTIALKEEVLNAKASTEEKVAESEGQLSEAAPEEAQPPEGEVANLQEDGQAQEDLESLDYSALLALAKEKGIEARKKVDIIEALKAL